MYKIYRPCPILKIDYFRVSDYGRTLARVLIQKAVLRTQILVQNISLGFNFSTLNGLRYAVVT